MADLKSNAERKVIVTKDGDEIAYDEYYGEKSKPIIDEIDRNYDVKYRMRREAEEAEER
jgi:hypothetical protein